MMRRIMGTKFLAGVLAMVLAVLFLAVPPRTQAAGAADLLTLVVMQVQVRNTVKHYDTKGRNELMEEYKKSEGVNTDPAPNEMLDRIMSRLTAAIAESEPSIKDKPYNYFVNEKESFNAFCSIGNNISVNKGVFDFCAYREDLVAAVVAHELVHGQKRHPQRGVNKQLNLLLVKGLIAPKGGIAADLVATHAMASGITKPGEREADNISFAYMAAAGYNVGAPAAVWQRIMDNQGKQSGNFFAALLNPSTHPAHKDRRDNFGKKLYEYSGDNVAVDTKSGEIKLNGRVFFKPAAYDGMSGLERAYIIAGRLAGVYRDGVILKGPALAENGRMTVDGRIIVAPGPQEQSAEELADIFNKLNNSRIRD